MREKPKSSPKRVLGASLLDDALGAAVAHADASERQEVINRQAVRRDDQSVPPASIRWREKPTRLVHLPHAIDLAESIAVLGLIEPLAVDRAAPPMLLGGGHRLLGVLLLDTKPEERTALLERLASQIAPLKPAHREEVEKRLAELAYQPQPLVQINRLDGDPLAIEIAENEKRRDYTRAEVLTLAERLESEGYSFKRGRRGKGDKEISGQRMLEVATGKSATTLWRLLGKSDAAEGSGKVRKAPGLRSATVFAWIEGLDDQAALHELIKHAKTRLAILAG